MNTQKQPTAGAGPAEPGDGRNTRQREEVRNMEEPRYPEVEVQLVGEDGNAFAILGRVSKALRRAGHGDDVAAYTAEATAGDYDELLAATMRWVSVG